MHDKKIREINGYRMLKILSVVDGKKEEREIEQLKEFANKHFDQLFDLAMIDLEIENERVPDLAVSFDKAADLFYMNSTKEQRKEFILEAIKMVRADEVLTRNENNMINRLFTAWLS